MKTCSGCGRLNPDVAASCAKCGTALAAGPDLPTARDLPAPPAVPIPVPSPAPTAAQSARPAASPAVRPVTARLPVAGVVDDGDDTPLDGFDEEAWRAAIGPKSQDWYLERFRDLEEKGRGWHTGWHWPAFFVTFFWLLYRRMWGWAVLWGVFAYAWTVANVIVLATSPLAGVAMLAARFVVPGLFATSLYHRRCGKLIDTLDEGVSRDRYLGRLEGAGGTGRAGFLIAILVIGIALIGILAAIALPAYQDYTQRARITQAGAFGRTQVDYATEEFERTGRFPYLLPTVPPSLQAVEGAAIDPQTGTIEVRLQPRPKGPGGAILYVPEVRPQQPLAWTCRVTGPLEKSARHACPAGP